MNSRRRAPGSQASLRAANRARVLSALTDIGPMTQVEIAEYTGLSRASISNIVKDLHAGEKVTLDPWVRNGRRAIRVTPIKATGKVAAIAIDERQLFFSLTTEPTELGNVTRLPLPSNHAPDDVLARCALLVSEHLDNRGLGRKDLASVAVSIAAPVDLTTGTVASTAILPRWAGVQPAAELEHALDVPGIVDNDAHLAALGEMKHGALVGAEHAVYVQYSYSVGAALILGGSLYKGPSGFAGELGHITIDEAGTVCGCGNRGCLDTLISEPALVDALRPAHGNVTLRDIVKLVGQGEPGASRVVSDAGAHLGVALASLVNILNPTLIVIGGLIAGCGEVLMGPTRVAMERSALPPSARRVSLHPGVLGQHAALVGAIEAGLSIATRG